MKTLFNRARNICSSDKLVEEEIFLKRTLQAIGYPEKFIDIHSKRRSEFTKTQLAARKDVYIRLKFKGDHLLNHIGHKIRSALGRVYPAAQLRILTTTRDIKFKDRERDLPNIFASNVIYQFACSCGDIYIGRTSRQLSKRISEHIPQWLRKSILNEDNEIGTRNPASSIARHLMETGHKVDPVNSFSILLRNTNAKILSLSEALFIRLRKPTLCIQKCLTQTVCLPWQ